MGDEKTFTGMVLRGVGPPHRRVWCGGLEVVGERTYLVLETYQMFGGVMKEIVDGPMEPGRYRVEIYRDL